MYVTDCTVNSIQRYMLHRSVIGLNQGCTVYHNINAILLSNSKCTITIYSVCIMYDVFLLFPEFPQKIILYDVMEWK